MRYLKGSVSLQYRDCALLHAVADARYITHSQLFQLSRLHAGDFKRPMFNWRVRRLVNCGLLRKQVVPYPGADALYSITRGGVHALEEMGIVYLGDFVEREKDPTEAQIPHVLELNRIRLALGKSRVLLYWVPEVFIRALNQSPAFNYAKVYDAVATVQLADDKRVDFAIEYERTLKSGQKYAKILEAIEGEQRLHSILCLAPSFEILVSLRWYFERTRLNVLFATANDFKKEALNTQVDQAGTYRRMTLAEALVTERVRETSKVRVKL